MWHAARTVEAQQRQPVSEVRCSAVSHTSLWLCLGFFPSSHAVFPPVLAQRGTRRPAHVGLGMTIMYQLFPRTPSARIMPDGKVYDGL